MYLILKSFKDFFEYHSKRYTIYFSGFFNLIFHNSKMNKNQDYKTKIYNL